MTAQILEFRVPDHQWPHVPYQEPDDQIARAPSPVRAYREKNGAGFLILSGFVWAFAAVGFAHAVATLMRHL